MASSQTLAGSDKNLRSEIKLLPACSTEPHKLDWEKEDFHKKMS